VDELQLCDVTAILALGGAANVWVAFSAEIGLADAIRRIETAGFDPAEAERPEYLHAALAEVANIVLGHCTADLGALAGLVSLSTPMVIEQRRHLMRPHDVEFARVSFETSQGTLLIACITPREHFDHRLNPLSPAKEPT
jgi:CheY-specific phosphatase CheX